MRHYNGRFYIDPTALFSDSPSNSAALRLNGRECRSGTAEDSLRNEWKRVVLSRAKDPNNLHFLAARSAILAKLKAEGLPSPFRDDDEAINR